jgi:CP family cyanate transporter-like MFS transporter
LSPTAAAGRAGVVVALVVAAAVVVSLNVGKLPSALPLLRTEFGLDLVAASLLVSFFQLAGMLLGLFGGMLADRFGPRRVMRIGLTVAAAGSGLGALAETVTVLLASRAVESAGFILAVLPGPALLARHVDARRLRGVMGLWSAYMPLGMALGLALAPLAYETVGWRPVWWTIAAACLAMAAILGPAVGPDPRGRVPDDALGLVRDTLRSPRPWLLAGVFACYASQWMGVFTFLPTLYAEAGIALTLAGSLTALGVVVNVVGNLASGVLLQRGVSRAVLITAASVAMALGAWLCFGSDAPFAARYGGVLLFSAVGGLIPGTLFASTPAYAPHPRAVSTTTGLMQQGSTLGQFLSPPLIAAVASVSGGWHNTWWATGALACGALALAGMIARTDRRGGGYRGGPARSAP